MAPQGNRQFLLAKRPEGPARTRDFQLVERAKPTPAEGQVLFRNTLVSIDPYQRNLMGNGSSEWPALEIGDVMQGPTVARVEESRHPEFAIGDIVQTWSGWQDYALSDGSDIRKLDPAVAPVSTALGPLGLTGFTAWYGMTKLHDFKPGGTLVVTGAAGAVGSTAAQLGKLRGMRVVGVAGGEQKVDFLLNELALDAALDYKAPDFADQVAAALPEGIDAFYENVGGPIFPVLMEHFNKEAKITICGTIADYSSTDLPQGTNYLPRLITLIHYRFISLKAFAVPFVLDCFPEFLSEMTPLVTEGQIRYREDFMDGFENLPEAFQTLFDGRYSGSKLIVRPD